MLKQSYFLIMIKVADEAIQRNYLKEDRLYPGIAPGWVYYFRPTIAAFAITGTNPYYWALTDPRGGIILNKCYNAITGTNPYSWTLTDPRGVRVRLTYQYAGTLMVPCTGISSSKQAST